ncbi:hypothetical protein BV898_13761 [Hypsibius exemplaris]|uniref:Uncharacterized protein n=1 Tax=Hypsibius exemplaris TaxID=2072580 RepID=A0A1W0W9T5_HYPEX|nr:hypothetical protein BV898_13761 [Hypsibius exemplaris]
MKSLLFLILAIFSLINGALFADPPTASSINGLGISCQSTRNCLALKKIVDTLPPLFANLYGQAIRNVPTDRRPLMCRDLSTIKACQERYMMRCDPGSLQSEVNSINGILKKSCPVPTNNTIVLLPTPVAVPPAPVVIVMLPSAQNISVISPTNATSGEIPVMPNQTVLLIPSSEPTIAPVVITPIVLQPVVITNDTAREARKTDEITTEATAAQTSTVPIALPVVVSSVNNATVVEVPAATNLTIATNETIVPVLPMTNQTSQLHILTVEDPSWTLPPPIDLGNETNAHNMTEHDHMMMLTNETVLSSTNANVTVQPVPLSVTDNRKMALTPVVAATPHSGGPSPSNVYSRHGCVSVVVLPLSIYIYTLTFG